jgi:hypothetical protein
MALADIRAATLLSPEEKADEENEVRQMYRIQQRMCKREAQRREAEAQRREAHAQQREAEAQRREAHAPLREATNPCGDHAAVHICDVRVTLS